MIASKTLLQVPAMLQVVIEVSLTNWLRQKSMLQVVDKKSVTSCNEKQRCAMTKDFVLDSDKRHEAKKRVTARKGQEQCCSWQQSTVLQRFTKIVFQVAKDVVHVAAKN